jgi:hypothetical protein
MQEGVVEADSTHTASAAERTEAKEGGRGKIAARKDTGSRESVSPAEEKTVTVPAVTPLKARQTATEPSRGFRFSGHQTFPFRYGWLKKAADHTDALGREDAIVRLGVGKNMVSSIRHWALATQLFEGQGKGVVRPTTIGSQLLTDWDPYLEDQGSLWLIHWKLTTNPSCAAAWFLAFHCFPRPEFTKAELVDYVVDFVEAHGLRPKANTLGRDVDCLVRTYVPSRSSEVKFAEESFDCPLVELGLLQRLRDGETYQFAVGPKPGLPAEVFGAALFEFLEEKGSRETASVHECVYGKGSPGQAFKLDENSVVEYLEELHRMTDGAVELDDTAGLKQIYRRRQGDWRVLLDQYFGKGQAA